MKARVRMNEGRCEATAVFGTWRVWFAVGTVMTGLFERR